MNDHVALTNKELFDISALDGPFFCKTFFPNTFRMPSPPEDVATWDALDDPSIPYLNLRQFRGSAKTTRIRTCVARRVAYRTSRTVMFICRSEAKAVSGVQWLRTQIEKNRKFVEVYRLRPGKKWQENEIEIISDIDNTTSWIIGMGITGSVRGTNFDDYRPDFIALDDVMDEENTATLEQREKIAELILGSIANTLAPPTEAPNAKMVMLQTPLHPDDASARAERNPAWVTRNFGCWSKETADLPIGMRKSAWEVRFPTEFLRKKREEHLFENKLSVFSREWECKLSTPELNSFKPNWIQYYDDEEIPVGMSVLAIDPVPPPSQAQLRRSLKGKDMEVQLVLTKTSRGYFVREYTFNNSHEANWTVTNALRLAIKYNVYRIAIETVNYQLVLRGLLETEMRRIGRYFAIHEVTAHRSKPIRITNNLSGPLSQGRVWLRRSHTELVEQILDYSATSGGHDDFVDALSIAISAIGPAVVELEESEYREIDESAYADLPQITRCP